MLTGVGWGGVGQGEGTTCFPDFPLAPVSPAVPRLQDD